jgi:anti-sigma28 factor (negative regulator of flagellin synthesis)
MSISPIGPNTPITRLHGSTAVSGAQRSQDVSTSALDTVEISDHARYLSEVNDSPVRADKVQAARDAIDSGRYETPDRIDGTVDSLLEDLNTVFKKV